MAFTHTLHMHAFHNFLVLATREHGVTLTWREQTWRDMNNCGNQNSLQV
jgi:hypothetical protein